MSADRGHRLAYVAALAAITFWGLSFVATKAALRELTPVALVFTRFALGCAVLHAVLVARREPLLPPRSSLKSLALIGFIGVFVHQMLQANALTRTTAVQTGWLIGITPIWSALLATWFLHERLSRKGIIGLVVGLLGALIVISRGQLSAQVLATPATLGDLLILASTVNWAVCTVLARGPMRALGSSRATAGSMLIGWLMLAPFFFAESGWRGWSHLSQAGMAATLFLGIGCSGFAYLCWYGALARLGASRVSAFLYIEPLVTCVAAVPLLDEPLTASTVLGGLVVLLGVALVQSREA